MPITPGFTWEETENGLEVRVELKGFKRSDLDANCTACLLKVNCPPYLLSIDLHGEINPTKSSAVVDASGVTFNCVKEVPGKWGKLKIEGDRAEIKERREKSMEAERIRQQEVAAKQKEIKEKAQKAGQEGDWAHENKVRNTIDKRKEDELAAEREDIEKWKETMAARKRRAEQKTVTRKGGVEIYSDDESDDEDPYDDPYEDDEDDDKENTDTSAVGDKENSVPPTNQVGEAAESSVPEASSALVQRVQQEEEEEE
eukprot:CAMPEP_0197861910 /NCGR_PEP_ID=MMETSP1438-20131217/38257_1 /TAXON_ID=1461541 /ORGANISM="Pterosperma sp., Strain CCMP1384" /LENGTH=256 /DNA_ID=CAMNT_0043479261 /DNA_START=357 /DNA_END=1124 /DNA_ORIENTATION=+